MTASTVREEILTCGLCDLTYLSGNSGPRLSDKHRRAQRSSIFRRPTLHTMQLNLISISGVSQIEKIAGAKPANVLNCHNQEFETFACKAHRIVNLGLICLKGCYPSPEQGKAEASGNGSVGMKR